MIRAGELRHEVVLLRPDTSVQDKIGQPVVVWTAASTVWAAVKPIAGREFFAAEKLNSEVTHRIIMRYYDGGITAAWRVKFGMRNFRIESVIVPNEVESEMQLMCKEVFGEAS